MSPDDWIKAVQALGFPACVCGALLYLFHTGLRSGFGAVHARIDETNRRLGVLAYLLAKAAGDDSLREAEEANGIASNGEATKKKTA